MQKGCGTDRMQKGYKKDAERIQKGCGWMLKGCGKDAKRMRKG